MSVKEIMENDPIHVLLQFMMDCDTVVVRRPGHGDFDFILTNKDGKNVGKNTWEYSIKLVAHGE